jgi:outer membrane protein insertion porin family
LDLVYSIEEGQPWRAGRINVNIEGEHPHTRQSVVLNRMSIRPGDLIDIREVRASERRLKASQLFANDPMQGNPPQVRVRPPELADLVETIVEGREPATRPTAASSLMSPETIG